MAQFLLLVSGTKLIFSTSSSLPPSIPHMCHLTVSHTPGSSEAYLEDALNRYDCTDQEAEVLLRSIKPHSATGPDGVTSWMLCSFSEDIAPSVSSLLNLSIRNGQIPSDWNFPMLCQSQRSLLVTVCNHFGLSPILSKCLEKHLYQLLLEHFESNSVLSDSQFGFRKGRSTIVPLMVAVHHSHQFLERKQQVMCVFFDIHKAFDSVPHQALLNKLSSLNIPFILLRWLTGYLTSRLQHVALGGVCSPWLPVKSGVPQGSV